MDARALDRVTLRPMEVVSVCPLRAGSVLWETASGALTLTVVAKATYLLRPSESPLATLQDVPTEGDEHWDDDERRSLVPFKRCAAARDA